MAIGGCGEAVKAAIETMVAPQLLSRANRSVTDIEKLMVTTAGKSIERPSFSTVFAIDQAAIPIKITVIPQ